MECKMSLNEREIMMENRDKFLRYGKGSNCGMLPLKLRIYCGIFGILAGKHPRKAHFA
jgi:hypothetical protein